ncbi:MAG TPA: hypothetical protein VLE23_09675, partial [Geminicoccaceae bacterium]|nr:hypothetical protein [Geminicoccaceae bacterium]
YPIGMDVMALLYERVVGEPEFRANLPRRDRPDAERELAASFEALAARIGKILAEPGTAQQITALQRGFHYPRHSYHLPDVLSQVAGDRYRVRAEGIRLVRQGGRFGLVPEGSRAATEVPAEVSGMVAWVLERREFSAGDLAAAFPGRPASQRDRLLRDLGAMRLIEAL